MSDWTGTNLFRDGLDGVVKADTVLVHHPESFLKGLLKTPADGHNLPCWEKMFQQNPLKRLQMYYRIEKNSLRPMSFFLWFSKEIAKNLANVNETTWLSKSMCEDLLSNTAWIPKLISKYNERIFFFCLTLTNTLHGAANLRGNPEKLAEIPTRDLHHTIIQTRLKVCSCWIGNRISRRQSYCKYPFTKCTDSN